MTDIEREQNKKNCNNCKYGYSSSICRKPNTEICGNNFSQWTPISKPYKAESEDKVDNEDT